MKRQRPTIERLHEVYTYNPVTGDIISRAKNHRMRKKIGGYIAVRVDGTFLLGHRVAWAITHGSWPTEKIDHINGVKDDNRLENLRDVTNAVNMQNQRRPHADSKSGILGVFPTKGKKFIARIIVHGTVHNLGRFEDPLEAHQAYLSAKRVLQCGHAPNAQG